MEDYCSVCGKELDDYGIHTCFGCGDIVCSDDYDDVSGYCVNCADNAPYCGC